MDRAAFEGVEILRRAYSSRTGDSEVCRGRDGLEAVRLRIRESACQRACLDGGFPARARLERGVLELLYPFRDGVSLGEWLFTKSPGLGERRDGCLALLAQCMEERVPPCVLALSAREENLRVSHRGVGLLYLADWGAWREGLTRGDAVRAVSELCREILTRGSPRGAPLPVELRLILRRTEEGDYADWGTLQRDLAALPDAAPTLEQTGRRLLRELGRRAERFREPAVCLLTAAALTLALLSLAQEAVQKRRERSALWPGMTAVAGQEWGAEP